MTTHTPPHHNNLTCYRAYNCDRPECIQRTRNYERNREQALNNGTWQPYIDAEPVRQHLLALNAAGITDARVAQLTGLSYRTVSGFTHPRSNRGRKHGTRPETANKILALSVDNTRPSHIDPTGACRRIGALVANGWPMNQLAIRLDASSPSFVWGIFQRTTIRVTTAEAIENLYRELHDKRAERCGIDEVSAKRARARAARNRWAPPTYWDQYPDAIDDPHFTPEYKKTRAETIAEEAHWLITAGSSRDTAAARLGVSRFYIDRALREHPQDAAHRADTYREAA